MLPTLFRIGHFHVSTYGVVVAIAALTAGWIAARGFRERSLKADDAWSLFGYGLIGGFVGAKLYYVALHGDPSLLLSRGGFVWYGGLIGGGLAVLLGTIAKGVPLGLAADAFAPALAIGHGLGHIGCFFSGDSYGLPTSLPWGVAFPRGAPPSTARALRTDFGVAVPANIPDDAVLAVHPTMLYSAATLIAVFAVLWAVRNRRMPVGGLFALYLVFTGVERFLVEFLRAKDDRLLWGFTTAQALAAAAVVAGGIILLATLRRRHRRPAVTMAATNALH